ncbi:tripartite tricarboxylate transporter TctB family protein [Acetonema longum]|nr:tripartite tricarboxylate transporter TctB family protein [Acetonema longum]
MGKKMFDRLAGGAFLLVGLLAVAGSFQIADSAYGSKVGPSIFPLGLGAIITFLSLGLIYQTCQYKQDTKAKADRDYKRLGLMLLALCLYIALFETLGYIVSTFLFLLAAFQIMERSKLWFSAGIAAFFSVGAYYLYVVMLHGSLPPFPYW